MSRWRDINLLIDIVTQVGIRLTAAQPKGKRDQQIDDAKLKSSYRACYWKYCQTCFKSN